MNQEEYLNQHFKFKNGQESNKTKKEELQNRNPFNPFDYVDLFKKYDIPLIVDDWNRLLQKQIKNQKPLIFVFGKYLSTMKLKGYRGYCFNDSQAFFQCSIDKYLYYKHLYNN